MEVDEANTANSLGSLENVDRINIVDSSKKRQRVPGKELQLALQALFSEEMEILACVAKRAAKLVRMAHASSLSSSLADLCNLFI